MEKVVLRIALIIILQKPELIHVILYLLKKYWLFIVLLIQSAVNENKNKYYYNIFLEKDSYKDKSYTQSFLFLFVYCKMLYFDRIEVSEGIDVNKTSESKECNVCSITINIF